MEDRVSRLVRALGPVMNSIQAEGFLHVAAFTCSKSLESLSAEDWPKIETAVREALAHVRSDETIERIIDGLRVVFLEEANGSEC